MNTRTLHCEAGHSWQAPVKRGRKPRFCPKHAQEPEPTVKLERVVAPEPDRSSRRGFTITKFERHEDGYFHARVTAADGNPVYVHERFGSWLAPVTVESRPNIAHKEVNREVVEALLDKQRKQESRERKEQEQSEAA